VTEKVLKRGSIIFANVKQKGKKEKKGDDGEVLSAWKIQVEHRGGGREEEVNGFKIRPLHFLHS